MASDLVLVMRRSIWHTIRLTIRGWLLAGACLLCSGLVGCSTDRDASDFYSPSEVDVLVLDGRLLVGKPLPSVYVWQTLPPDVPYTIAASAVRGARVRLTVHTDTPEIALAYRASPLIDGQYDPPPDSALVVQPNTRYSLVVEADDGRRASATTTTPGPFEVDSWVLLDDTGTTLRRSLLTYEEVGDSVYVVPENQVVYQDGLLEARFRAANTPAYQIGLLNLEQDSPFVIDTSIFDDETLDDLGRENNSPALEAADDFIRMPWFAIYYAGRHKIFLYAIDRNWFDLIRTSRFLGGGPGGFGGLAGDDVDRPVFHVEGGIGLFGSASVDSIGFVILPPP